MAGIIVILLIFYVVYLDSRTLRQESSLLYDETMSMSPFLWALLVFLLLIVALPIYLYKRHQFLTQLNPIRIMPPDGESGSPAEAYMLPFSDNQETLSAQEIEPYEQPALHAANPFFPRIVETTGVFLNWSLLIAALNIFNFILSKLHPVFDAMLMQFTLRSIFSNIVMITLIYFAIKANSTKGFWESLYVKKANRFLFFTFIVPIALGMALAAMNYSILISRGIQSQSPMQQALADSPPVALSVFLLVALGTAPFLEELIFRGYFFSAIQKIKGKWFAVGTITLVFTIFHVEQLWGDWLAIFLIGALSLGITLLRALSGTTTPGIVMHYTYNISMFIIVPMLAMFFSNPAFFEYTIKSSQLDPVEKEQLLKQNIYDNPDFIPAYNHLAWLYAEEDKSLNEALQLVETALTSEPDNPAYLDTKAEVLYKMGRYDEAINIESYLCEKYGQDSMFKKQLEKFISAKKSSD